MRMNPNARKWSELSGFKRDAIVAALRLGGSPGSEPEDRPYGLGIKRELEIIRDVEVNHGRLYPNLDDLVDAGLMSKGERDKRTNTYHVTQAGVDAFEGYLGHYAGISPAGLGVAHAPAEEFDKQTSNERGSGE